MGKGVRERIMRHSIFKLLFDMTKNGWAPITAWDSDTTEKAFTAKVLKGLYALRCMVKGGDPIFSTQMG